jgi:hypothetical protein
LLFSCGVAAEYEGCETYGLAITARCDTANDKVQIYNYLPVVALDDWLHRDGRMILAERLEAEALGGLKAVLRDSGYNPAVLDTEKPDFLVAHFFPVTATEKAKIAARKRATDQLQRYELAQRAKQSLPQERICLEVAATHQKYVTSLIDELVRHKLGGYYFLEQVDVNGDDRGFVVLVREIQAIPRKLAQLIVDGLDRQAFAAICAASPEFRGRLQISSEQLAMPVGMVKSPNIEHLMQSFALLFGRIGIADLTNDYISSLWARQPSVTEVPK